MTDAQTEARAIAPDCEHYNAADKIWRLSVVECKHAIATALAAKDAEMAKLELERDKWEQHACTGDDVLARTRSKLKRAEAQLARVLAEKNAELDGAVFLKDAAEAALRKREVEINKLHAQLAEARKALEPFAWIGQWLFARDLPDETPVVMVEGAGKPFALTRGMFKAAHTAARRALEAQGGENG